MQFQFSETAFDYRIRRTFPGFVQLATECRIEYHLASKLYPAANHFSEALFDYKSQDLLQLDTKCRIENNLTSKLYPAASQFNETSFLHTMINKRYSSENITIPQYTATNTNYEQTRKKYIYSVNPNQTWIVITSIRIIWHQTEFSLVPVQSNNTISCSFSCGMQFQFSETTFDYKMQEFIQLPTQCRIEYHLGLCHQ